eukprot:Nk52_evm2s905 gene=Nk52_evmTU2s905
MTVKIYQVVVLITAIFCISSLGVFAAPMNEDDPFSPILLRKDSIAHSPLSDAVHKSHDIISRTADILSSPIHNVRVPPSERKQENHMLKYQRSAVAGQTVEETRAYLKDFGSVNTMADAVSVISLAKINALYEQKYTDAKDDTNKFTNFTSTPYTPWGTSTAFWVDLAFGPPLWVFVDETLQMTMEMKAGRVQQYFTETFHDKDYILGTVILNPEDPAIINGLSPKSFIMETVKDAFSRSGNGFLVIMIQTDGAALTDMTRNQNPTKFNMVPDGYDSALYITNRALYNSIYLESFKPVVSNLKATGDGKGGLMYKTGDVALGELTQPSECHDSDSMFGGCRYTNETSMIYTTSFISSPSNDATPNRFSVHAAGTIQFVGCNLYVPFMSKRPSCAEADADGEFTLDMDFDFTLDKSDEISVKAASSHKFSGNFESSFFDDLKGLTEKYVKKSADAWGAKASKAVEDHPPKIQSLNTFRLERILFPRQSNEGIYVADLRRQIVAKYRYEGVTVEEGNIIDKNDAWDDEEEKDMEDKHQAAQAWVQVVKVTAIRNTAMANLGRAGNRGRGNYQRGGSGGYHGYNNNNSFRGNSYRGREDSLDDQKTVYALTARQIPFVLDGIRYIEPPQEHISCEWIFDYLIDESHQAKNGFSEVMRGAKRLQCPSCAFAVAYCYELGLGVRRSKRKEKSWDKKAKEWEANVFTFGRFSSQRRVRNDDNWRVQREERLLERANGNSGRNSSGSCLIL